MFFISLLITPELAIGIQHFFKVTLQYNCHEVYVSYLLLAASCEMLYTACTLQNFFLACIFGTVTFYMLSEVHP
jgi:hypothetical protein